MVDFGDILLGGMLGAALSSHSHEQDRTAIRRSLSGRDQISLIIKLPIDQVGRRLVGLSSLERGILLNSSESDFFHKMLVYDEKDKFLKYAHQETSFLGDPTGKIEVNDKYPSLRINELESDKTVLTLKICDSNGYRVLEEDEVIIVIYKFKDDIEFIT